MKISAHRATAPVALVCFSVLLAVAIPQNAAAYLDPGTGSMILQAVLGSLLAASVALGLFWGRVKRFLFAAKSAPEEEVQGPDAGAA